MELKRKIIFILYWLCMSVLALQSSLIVCAHPHSWLSWSIAIPGLLWAVWMAYKGGDVRWRA